MANETGNATAGDRVQEWFLDAKDWAGRREPTGLEDLIVLLGFLFVVLFVAARARHITGAWWETEGKVVGAVLVVTLSALARHGAIYFAAVFIIGVLVAPPSYLSELAAIILDRQWTREPQKPEEAIAEKLSEAEGEDPPAKGAADAKARAPYYQRALEFEESAVAAIQRLFPPGVSIERNIAFGRGKGDRHSVDAIIHTSATDHLVEIKLVRKKENLERAAAALRDTVEGYRRAAGREARGREIRCTLVSAHPNDLPERPFDDVLNLRFDEATKQFALTDAARAWLR